MRHGMWEKVASRSHKPSMIYPFGKGGDDVMLHGTVDYELKDGKKAEGIEWAARAKFGSEHGNLKMVFYQVYLVSLSEGFDGNGRVDMLTGIYYRILRLWLVRRSRSFNELQKNVWLVTQRCRLCQCRTTLRLRIESALQCRRETVYLVITSPTKRQPMKVLPLDATSIRSHETTERQCT
jgi:hypothetical protein